MTPDGMIVHRSMYGPKETMDRLLTAATAQGMAVQARIDHAVAATIAGLDLRPTEVAIFGNPVGGTPLMQAAQTIGIDLPLKVLVWQDDAQDTWLAYNDPRWLAKRHRIEHEMSSRLDAMAALLATLAEAAIRAGEGNASLS